MSSSCNRPLLQTLMFAALACSFTQAARAQTDKPPVCDARTTVQALNDARIAAAAAIAGSYAVDPNKNAKLCASLGKVLWRLINGQKSGGRKLEGDKPMDLAEAERERQAALADPALRAELDSVLSQEPDAARRLVLEAAVMHNNSHYLARDLAMRQLQPGAAK